MSEKQAQKTVIPNKSISPDYLLFAADFTLLLTAYGGYFRESFSADTLGELIWPYMNINNWIASGRFLAFALGRLLVFLGLRTFTCYKVYYVIFMLLITVSLFIIQKSVYPVIYNRFSLTYAMRFTLFCISGLLFVNGLFSDYFMFPECFLTFSLSYFFASLGLSFYLRDRKRRACFFLLISALFYQTPLIMIALIILACKTIQSGPFRALLQSYLLVIILCLGLIAFTILVGNFVELSLLDGLRDYLPSTLNVGFTINNSSYILKNFLRSGCGLMPAAYLPLMVLSLPLIFCLYISGKNGTPKHAGSVFLYAVISIVLSFSITIAAGANSSSGRTLCGLYVAQAALIMLALLLCAKERIRMFLTALAGGYLILQIISCNMIMSNHYVSNALDIAYAENVYAQILSYEEASGVKIRTIVSASDAVCYDSYDNVYYKFGETNARSIHRTPYCMLTYVSIRDDRFFELGELDDETYQAYFEGRDWNTFLPQEQLIFSGDTLYWCIY